MSTGHILPGQMPPRGLASVKHGPRSLLLKFGKNWVVIVEIFLIWTNVALTNVALTNVALTNVAWTKCCLDKCHYGSWNLF